LNYKQ